MPGIANVTTFNAPRPPIISTVTAGTVNQINIIARGDFVGDPRKSISDFNAGYRAGPGCLDSAPLDLSGFLPGYAERGALRFCR
ncbi:hypothetical protein ACVI7B_009062, partial [Bradyrhizobium elkanii]